MMERNRKTRGFTLVEVLLVIAILGVLAGVFAYTMSGRLDKSKIDAARLLIEQISSKLAAYSIDIGHYPSEDEGGINALLTKPAFDDESLAAKWVGPYISRKQLKDPWGKELGYELVDKEQGGTTRQVVHVWSYGPNGEDDSGEGDDVKNWEDEDGGR
ncbi:MAG: type II secretion system major pseudopilin GspG [Phycisphaerae bacterium]|nr:type II secretion system major pseudopilin GspG [Phycisphaerae bacterium]